jgi:hypothetical protein
MMKRVLLYLCLVSIGAAPALADPRRSHGGGPPGYGAGGGGRPGYGGPPRGAPPGYAGPRGNGAGHRDYDPDIDDRPRRRQDQDSARDAMRAGTIRPLRDIQQKWRGDMPGYDYLGSDYDPGAGSYRLKFLRDGSVVWIDVDGRTGREIGRHGR